MVKVVKGGGRAPPPPPARANFTLMTECTPESDCCYSVYSVVYTLPPCVLAHTFHSSLSLVTNLCPVWFLFLFSLLVFSFTSHFPSLFPPYTDGAVYPSAILTDKVAGSIRTGEESDDAVHRGR